MESLADEINGAQPKDDKAPEDDHVETSRPEIAGLPFLDQSVYDEVPQSLPDRREPRIRLTLAEELIAPKKNVSEKGQADKQDEPCEYISRDTEIGLGGWMVR
jgi:hypothetical protein